MLFTAAVLVQLGTTLAGVTLPAEPKDKTTPVQQRLSFNSPKWYAILVRAELVTNSISRLRGMEHI